MESTSRTHSSTIAFESLFSPAPVQTASFGHRVMNSVVDWFKGMASNSSTSPSSQKTRTVTSLSTEEASPSSHPIIISWAADIHCDHVDEHAIDHFAQNTNAQNPSALLLAGDIDLGKENPVSQPFNQVIPANGLINTVEKIKNKVNCPVYFICGNHDFYYSSFNQDRQKERDLDQRVPDIRYIHETEGIELKSDTVLVGHDGWADSRSGDFYQSELALNDFFLIDDIKVERARDIPKPETKAKLEALGDASAAYAKRVLPGLLAKYNKVIFLTHVPPFREASWHEGHITDDGGAPFFVNQALGESLVEIMKEHPDNELLVFCGHTHCKARYQAQHNLTVLTAGAAYGKPAPQTPIKV